MRTTLNLDPVVLSAARARAAVEGISLGAAVSELARAGLRAQRLEASAETSSAPPGFPVLSGVPDHPVTDDLVYEHRDDDVA